MTTRMQRLLGFGLLLGMGCAQGSDGAGIHDAGAIGGGGGTGSGGTSASGGSSAVGGSGGKGGGTGTGGSTSKGGASGSGGTQSTGGTAGSSGATGSGGSSGSGGTSASGGSSSGGTSASGGSPGSGGTSSSAGTDAGGDVVVSSDASGCKTPTQAQAPSGVTPLRAIDGFVTRDGSTLMLCGQPFQAVGTNVYYAQSYSCYGSSGVSNVTDAFDDMVRMSLPVVRMWAYYDGTAGNDAAVIQTAPGTYSETALVGLDTAIAEAKKRGIRVILTLTNYWTAYGGLPQYVTWAGASSVDDFYTNTKMQGYFKDYATMLSKRTNTVTGVPYVNEPAILAWEIANELRCPKCTDSSAVLATIDTLSKFLKSIFPNHLIADGGEGMDDTPSNWGTLSNNYPVSGWERTSYTGLVKLSAIDMASYHYYPVDWGLTSIDSDSQVWVDGHAALAKQAGKVAYWGEFGYQKGASDSVRAPYYDKWLSEFFNSTNNGTTALFWQLDPITHQADDGYAVIISRDPVTVGVIEKYSQPLALR